VEPLVIEKLSAHGYAADHAAAVTQALHEILDAELPSGNERPMRLAHISSADRLNELEFYFPVANPMVRGVPQGAQLSLAFAGASPVTKLTAGHLVEAFADQPFRQRA